MFKQWFLQEEADPGVGGGGAPAAPAAPATPAAPASAPAPAAPKPEVKPSWAENWRQQISEDPKHQKTLERFGSPRDMWNSYEALRQRLSSGELKATVPFPEKGTPEEQTAWRTENGIPAAPDKYDIKFDDGLVIGEADKPIIDGYLKAAHAANIPVPAAKATIKWYYDHIAELTKQNDEKRAEAKKVTEDTLRAEWGTEFRANQNQIAGLLDGYVSRDNELYPKLTRELETNPDFARMMGRIAREISPVPSIMSPDGATTASKVEDRIKQIEDVMKTDRKKYNSDTKMQQEYRELLNFKARDKKG